MPDIDQSLVPLEHIASLVYFIRGKKIMVDYDLALLYGVEVKQLKRSVKRNSERFPDDFMFTMSKDENDCLRYQFGTLKRGEHSKYLPMAFTEQGVAMLSSVLNSERAIMVNIQIIRTFTKLREMIASHEDLKLKLESLEKHYDEQFKTVFDALRKLLEDDEKPKPQIGFTLK